MNKMLKIAGIVIVLGLVLHVTMKIDQEQMCNRGDYQWCASN